MSANTSQTGGAAADPNAAPINLTDPFDLFDEWLREAAAKEADPTAMTLASVTATGRPDARMVLLNGVDGAAAPPAQRGFLFYTNLGSVKSRQITVNPLVSLCFHWKSVKRQVRIMGAAHSVSPAEADAYFATRPRQAQLGAWASHQSSPLPSRAVLEQQVELFAEKFPGRVPRPEFWSGFRVVPDSIEFWRDRFFRLHDRFLFTRDDPQSPWTCGLLYP